MVLIFESYIPMSVLHSGLWIENRKLKTEKGGKSKIIILWSQPFLKTTLFCPCPYLLIVFCALHCSHQNHITSCGSRPTSTDDWLWAVWYNFHAKTWRFSSSPTTHSGNSQKSYVGHFLLMGETVPDSGETAHYKVSALFTRNTTDLSSWVKAWNKWACGKHRSGGAGRHTVSWTCNFLSYFCVTLTFSPPVFASRSRLWNSLL